jgi:cytidine deaminase
MEEEYYTIVKTESWKECSSKDLFFIDRAVATAYHSDFTSSLRLGACIVLHKKRYFCGYNQKARTKIYKSHYHSLHAEIHALSIFVKQEYNKYSICDKHVEIIPVIYVARLMRDPDKASYGKSKPCNRCQQFLHNHSVRLIKYTDVDDDGKQILVTMEKC